MDRPATVQASPREEPVASRLAKLVEEQAREIRQLQQERFELAGRLGYFQAQLEQAQATIKALSPPAASNEAESGQDRPASVVATVEGSRPWWRFW